jgi:hypothetical protein
MKNGDSRSSSSMSGRIDGFLVRSTPAAQDKHGREATGRTVTPDVPQLKDQSGAAALASRVSPSLSADHRRVNHGSDVEVRCPAKHRQPLRMLRSTLTSPARRP